MIKPTQFDIESELVDGSGRLTVAGELDIATVPLLKQEAYALLARAARDLLIDLSRVTFIDSSGLSLFIALNDRARGEGWTLSLTRPPDIAFAVFAVTGADRNLPFIDAKGSS
jgi:anti-sigma B factor antagonist